VLQARAREACRPAGSRPGTGHGRHDTAEPDLVAALAVAAWRTIHLQAIRAILAGEDSATVAAQYPGRIGSVLSAVDQMTA
jgi:hypothetical protein